MAQPERPILRYFGGKWMLAPWIIENMPAHRFYVEPFGGAASVLMRKPRSLAEVYNDLDDEIVNVFRIMQDERYNRELERLLKATPYARVEYDLAYEGTYDAIEKARRTIIRSFMGHGADSATGSSKSGFRENSNQSNRTPAMDWINYAPCLAAFLGRLKGVVIENRDYWTVCESQDSPDTLHFLDPPYVTDTRNHKTGYRYEMSDLDHELMCERVRTLKGMVMICGYQNDLYDQLGWETIDRESLADGASPRTETLWLNSAAAAAQAQGRLL